MNLQQLKTTFPILILLVIVSIACDQEATTEPIVEVIEEEEEVEVIVETYDPRDILVGDYIGYAKYQKYDSSSLHLIIIDTMVLDTVKISKLRDNDILLESSQIPDWRYNFSIEGYNEHYFSHKKNYYSSIVPGLLDYTYDREVEYKYDNNYDLYIFDDYYTLSDSFDIFRTKYVFEGNEK